MTRGYYLQVQRDSPDTVVVSDNIELQYGVGSNLIEALKDYTKTLEEYRELTKDDPFLSKRLERFISLKEDD